MTNSERKGRALKDNPTELYDLYRSPDPHNYILTFIERNFR